MKIMYPSSCTKEKNRLGCLFCQIKSRRKGCGFSHCAINDALILFHRDEVNIEEGIVHELVHSLLDNLLSSEYNRLELHELNRNFDLLLRKIHTEYGYKQFYPLTYPRKDR